VLQALMGWKAVGSLLPPCKESLAQGLLAMCKEIRCPEANQAAWHLAAAISLQHVGGVELLSGTLQSLVGLLAPGTPVRVQEHALQWLTRCLTEGSDAQPSSKSESAGPLPSEKQAFAALVSQSNAMKHVAVVFEQALQGAPDFLLPAAARLLDLVNRSPLCKGIEAAARRDPRQSQAVKRAAELLQKPKLPRVAPTPVKTPQQTPLRATSTPSMHYRPSPVHGYKTSAATPSTSRSSTRPVSSQLSGPMSAPPAPSVSRLRGSSQLGSQLPSPKSTPAPPASAHKAPPIHKNTLGYEEGFLDI